MDPCAFGSVASGLALAAAKLREQDRRTYPASVLLRAASFRETEGLPMTVRRALALNAILEQSELVRLRGELLLGSSLGKAAPSGPPEALERARSVLADIGGRHFVTHADHAAPDYPSLLEHGPAGLLEQTRQRQRTFPAGSKEHVFLESVAISLEGLIACLHRWARSTSEASDDLSNHQARMLYALAERPPQTFWEALQLVYMTHCAFQFDDRYAMAIGRADQFLLPFYRRDREAGGLSEAGARLLVEHFVAKLTDRWDIQNVCVGGCTPDGEAAANELSLLFVEAVKRIARPGANLTARIGSSTPDWFVEACADCIRGGSGFPAVYNDEVQIPALTAQGYPLEDARDYCFVGCIEAFLPGKQAPWADSRFNLLRCVEQTLLSGEDYPDWPAFRSAVEERIREGVEAHVEEILRIEREADVRGMDLTSPLLSALTRDCVERGRDVNMGGARYPSNHGIAGMGIGSTADALAAVRQTVYEERRYSLEDLRAMMRANFAGYERERQYLLRRTPKYGNDDERADCHAVETARFFCEEVLRHQTASGGRFWGLMAANVQNVAAGREVGATPDGRLAGEPVSDAASPSFGRDRNGPTAVVRSVAKVDYRLAPGGNVVNMKLHPGAVAGDAGLRALTALIRTCFRLGGVQLQFNTVDREILLEAMRHPELHPDRVVRVSGFSAYFTQLDRAVQEDVLARTEHRAL